MSLVNIDSIEYKRIFGNSANSYALHINVTINNTTNYDKGFNSPVVLSVKDADQWKHEMGTIFLLNPPIFQSKKFSYIKGRKIYETLKYIKVAKKGSLSFTIIYVFNEYADEGHYLYPNMVDANGQPVKGIINPWVFPSVLWTDIYAKFSTTILPLSINLTCNINNVNYTVTKNCSWNLITNTIV